MCGVYVWQEPASEKQQPSKRESLMEEEPTSEGAAALEDDDDDADRPAAPQDFDDMEEEASFFGNHVVDSLQIQVRLAVYQRRLIQVALTTYSHTRRLPAF